MWLARKDNLFHPSPQSSKGSLSGEDVPLLQRLSQDQWQVPKVSHNHAPNHKATYFAVFFFPHYRAELRCYYFITVWVTENKHLFIIMTTRIISLSHKNSSSHPILLYIIVTILYCLYGLLILNYLCFVYRRSFLLKSQRQKLLQLEVQVQNSISCYSAAQRISDQSREQSV